MEAMDYSQKTYKIIFALFLVCFFVRPFVACAAMLSISPATGTYKVGDIFTVHIDVSSYSESMNAVSGVLSYPKDTLSVVGISKNNSLLTTWLPPGATGPRYSTSAGTISFEGVLIGGYSGGPKNVFTATFRVKKTGTAKLSFKNGTILANDGKGTDVTQALRPASFKLASAQAPSVAGFVKTKNIKSATPPQVVLKPEDAQVVDIVPVSAPVVTQTPEVVQKTAPDYYSIGILVGLGIIVILIFFLFVYVARLTRVVKQMQTRKKPASRKRVIAVPARKVIARPKSNGGIVLRGMASK